MQETIQILNLILHIITGLTAMFAAYWGRKALTTTRRVKRQLSRTPRVTVKLMEKRNGYPPETSGHGPGDSPT